MQKNLKLILIVVGVLLILAGVLLTVVIVPSMRVFPTDVDTTRTYDVDFLTMLNPTDLSFVRIGSDESEDLHIVRRIEVVEVDGNQTLIRETQTLMNGETPVRPPFVKYHALDRESMAFLASSPEEWITNEEYQDGYWQREGLVIGWGPEGVEQRDYVGWNDDIRATTELVFVEEREYSGMDTYYFTAGSEPMPIDAANVAVLGMPPALPIAALPALVAGLDIEDEATKAMVSEYLPSLMAYAVMETQDVVEGEALAVPLNYYYDYTGEYWVEQTTGVLIDTHKYEHRSASFPAEVLAKLGEAMRLFPDDVDTTRIYNLDYLTLLDASTMTFLRISAEDSADLFIERNILVEEVNGRQMLVRETQNIYNGEMLIMGPIVKYHAIDRLTMEALSNPPAEWTEMPGYAGREGLVIGWGLTGVEQMNYSGWSDDYNATVELVFVEEQEYSGMNTYYFTSQSEQLLIVPETVAAMGLPTQLPIPALGSLASGMDIEDEALKAQIATFLPMLFSTAVRETQDVEAGTELSVPLEYYYEYTAEYWVDPATGVLINTHKHESRAVTFPTEVLEHVAGQMEALGLDPLVLDTLLPLVVSEMEYSGSEQSIADATFDAQTAAGLLSVDLTATMGEMLPVTVNEFEYAATAASVEDAKNDAQDALDKLNMFGKTIPIIAIALGVLALISGWYLSFFGKEAAEE
jgi:hypothetical protein